MELEFEAAALQTAEVVGGQTVEVCVNLISGILTSDLEVTLTPNSIAGPGGATGKAVMQNTWTSIYIILVCACLG